MPTVNECPMNNERASQAAVLHRSEMAVAEGVSLTGPLGAGTSQTLLFAINLDTYVKFSSNRRHTPLIHETFSKKLRIQRKRMALSSVYRPKGGVYVYRLEFDYGI